MEHIENRSHPRAARFIKLHFDKGTNYNCGAITKLLDRFDPIWGEKFRTFQDSRDDIVQSVSSVYTLRNSVAHGGSANRGIMGIIDLYRAAVELVDELRSTTR